MFNDTALNVGTNAIIAAYPYLSLHTTGAVTSSANESTAARVAAGWAAASGGDTAITGNKAFTGGASAGPVVRVGYWSASTGGTYGGGALLSGDQAFNSAGEYTLTALAESFGSV